MRVRGYLFLAARFTAGRRGYLHGGVHRRGGVPVYAVFLTPEIFNFSLVFVAYFLWLYEEVATGTGRLRGLAAATSPPPCCSASATYSKPTNALLVGPLVLRPGGGDSWRAAS